MDANEILYDLLGEKIMPNLSDVELFIDEYNLESPLNALPDQGLATETWSPNGPPNRTCYSGPYDFKVELNSTDINKRKYLYSHHLHRIYVDMESDFSIHFNWNAPRAPHTMYVRATVVFTDDAQAEKRVERCTQHYYQNKKIPAMNEEEKVILKNVLHSSRELGSSGVEYCGVVDSDDSWFSVLVELTKTSDQSIAHAYKFVCKNSCPNGINRRSISIIFTLEDKDHKVYGRQMVGAKACACPRRDMHKDEDTENVRRGTKRPKPSAADRSAKIIKTEAVTNDGLNVLTLPPLQIIDDITVITGLEVMLNMMELALSKNTNPAAIDSYTTCITRLKDHISAMKNKTAS